MKSIKNKNNKISQLQVLNSTQPRPKIDMGVKVIINPMSARGKARVLWPEILRRLYQYYHYFDYEFTEWQHHAQSIAQNALEKGYSTIFIIGGKGTIQDAIIGLFQKTGKLINPDVQLVILPLTFELSSSKIPERVFDWDFSIDYKKQQILFQPLFYHLLSQQGNKIPGSRGVLLQTISLQNRIEIQYPKRKFIKLSKKQIQNSKSGIKIWLDDLQLQEVYAFDMTVVKNSVFNGKVNDLHCALIDEMKIFLPFVQIFSVKQWYPFSTMKALFNNDRSFFIDGKETTGYGFALYPSNEKIQCQFMHLK